jgi:hypothetical protein
MAVDSRKVSVIAESREVPELVEWIFTDAAFLSWDSILFYQSNSSRDDVQADPKQEGTVTARNKK